MRTLLILSITLFGLLPQFATAQDQLKALITNDRPMNPAAAKAEEQTFQGRSAGASRGAVQNEFEKEAITRVIQTCPQRFAEYRDGAMIEFRKCTVHFGAECKVKQKRAVDVCNQAALDACRSTMDNFLKNKCGDAETLPKAASKKEKPLVCRPSDHLEFASDGKSCECSQPYSMNKKTKSCAFGGARGLSLTGDAVDRLESIVGKLDADESGTVTLKLKNGKTIILGVIRLPNGKYLFTPDGEHYEDSPSDALSPGFLKNAGTSLGDLSKGFKGFFGIGKYVGSKEDKEDGQLMTDAATAALDRLQGDTDPGKSLDKARETLERYQTLGKNLLGKEYEEQLLEELKNASGVDIGLIKKILTGDLAGIGADVVKQLYTFPAESVIILAKELRGANFSNAARLYARERARSKTPAQIMALLSGGQLPELDFVSSIKGVGQSFGRGQLMLAYEEAYQRLQLAKKLKPLRK